MGSCSTVSGVGTSSAPATDAVGPDVAAAVRALHRRDGWTRAAITSFIACALGEGSYASATSQGTPPPRWFLGIVIALAALTVVSVIAVMVVSSQLGRMPAALRAQAAPIAARHPHGPHAHHYPPRHLVTWIVRWAGMLVILFVAVVAIPAPVNGVAYLAGAGRTATFDPLSHQTNCTQYDCQTSTDGILETGGTGLSATWPNVVPLGRPFQVREPTWRWGLGAALIDSDGIAVGAIVVSLLIEGAAVLVLIRVVRLVRTWRRHRQGQLEIASAPAV
jgi:hypothetical protein